MLRSRVFATLALGGLLSLAGHAALASSSTHAMTVSGHAHGGSGPFGCATSGPQAGAAAFFGQGVALPTEGYSGCNLAGGIQDVTKASGTALSHQDVTSTVNGGINMGAGDARSLSGLSLGASASDSLIGATFTDAFTFTEAEAYGIWTELLPALGSGMGFIQFGFSIDGKATATGNAFGQTLLDYQIDGGSIFTAFSAVTSGESSTFVANPTGAGLTGFTSSPGLVMGNGVANSFLTPIDLGNPFSLTLGLYTSAYSNPGGSIDNDFLNTAKITSISLFDATMHPLDVHFTSDSGVIYDANGAHAPATSGGVPEPATWAMLTLGFGLLGAAARRRRIRPMGAYV